jgi:hypothetical protein
MSAWGSSTEREVRQRIVVSVAAYAYEIADTPIMSDSMFDWNVSQVRPKLGTCHPIVDEFFASRFSPMTGMWIHEHPELDGIKRIFTRYYNVMRDYYADPRVQQQIRRQGP